MKWYWLCPIALCLSGCPPTTAPPGSSSNATVDRTTHVGTMATGVHKTQSVDAKAAGAKAADAAADGPLVAKLEVYQLAVPFGAISRNDEFWKHVDEVQLEPATYDLLIRNGVRIGVGADSDWKYFKELIDNYHATAQKGVAGVTREGTVELLMKTAVEFQDLFYLDGHDVLTGRTFEHCDDLLSISFYPHQRVEGDTVVKICPLIRALRKVFEFSVRNQEREIELHRPELLIDLRATIQVQADHFLIVGPSRVSDLPESLGRNFLVKTGNAEAVETVLIIVPKAYRVGADSIAVPVTP